MAVDIVCGKEISKEDINAPVGQIPAGAPETDPRAGTKRFYQGAWYYFCSLECRLKFTATPDDFISAAKEDGTRSAPPE